MVTLADEPVEDCKSYQQYAGDLQWLLELNDDGPTNTMCYGRLKVLSALYDLHVHLNRRLERKQLNGNGTDFFASCKVDNHIHLAGAFNGRDLLAFIRKKFVDDANAVVLKRADGRKVTLGEVASSLVSHESVQSRGRKAAMAAAQMIDYDQMETSADGACFQRFDVFNSRFSPFANPDLRLVFLKVDNLIKGLYFAQLTKGLISDLERQGGVAAEYRISMYGRHCQEWSGIARWLSTHGLQR